MKTVGPIEPDGIYVRAWPKKPLGELRKRFCLLLISLGACTFFLPMLILDSPVLNRTEWSALAIVSKLFEGKLRVQGGSFDLKLIAIAVIYLLMTFALMAVYRPGPPKALFVISCMGVALYGALRHGTWGMDTFGPSRMRAGLAWWVLMSIMPALLAICFAMNLDTPSSVQEKMYASKN